MTVFHRGLQVYLLALSLIAALTVTWGANLFVLENTTAGTGWPIIGVAAGALVVLGVVVRRHHSTAEEDGSRGPYPWSRRG